LSPSVYALQPSLPTHEEEGRAGAGAEGARAATGAGVAEQVVNEQVD